MAPQTFNQDAYLGALKPPVFIAGGLTHRGVILSAAEWFAFVDRLAGAAKDHVTQRRLIREFFDLVFPPPRPPSWRTPLRRWRWWRLRRHDPSVADLVAQLPFTGQVEAFELFSQALAEQNGAPPRAKSTPMPMDGAGSPS